MPAILLLALQPPATPLLDPPTRAVLVMALLAFVVLTVGLVAGVLLGGRWARRYGGDELKKPLKLHKRPTHGHSGKPALAPVDAALGETLAAGSETDDTQPEE